MRKPESEATYNTSYGSPLIQRDRYALKAYHLDPQGCCQTCGHPLAGRFDKTHGGFGNQRIPLRIQAN